MASVFIVLYFLDICFRQPSTSFLGREQSSLLRYQFNNYAINVGRM